MILMDELVSSLASAVASRAAARGAITTCAPLTKGKYSSSPAMSKEKVVTASSRSELEMPSCCCMDARKFTSERCSISTPLGFPVEPDVYRTYARFSGVAKEAGV